MGISPTIVCAAKHIEKYGTLFFPVRDETICNFTQKLLFRLQHRGFVLREDDGSNADAPSIAPATVLAEALFVLRDDIAAPHNDTPDNLSIILVGVFTLLASSGFSFCYVPNATPTTPENQAGDNHG